MHRTSISRKTSEMIWTLAFILPITIGFLFEVPILGSQSDDEWVPAGPDDCE